MTIRGGSYFIKGISIVFCLYFFAQALPAQAASLVVTKTADTMDGSCDTTDCSLREAVATANTNSDSDTITFAVDGTFTLSASNGSLNLNYGMTIQGNGPSKTVISGSGNYAGRVFTQNAGTSGQLFTLKQMTITNGSVHGSGGGISQEDTGNVLTVDTCIVSNNTIQSSDSAVFGAGIYSAGTLTVMNSTLTNNTILSSVNGQNHTGSAIAVGGNAAPTITLMNSTISSNTGENGGGAIAATTTFNGIFASYNLTISNNASNTVSTAANVNAGGVFNESTKTLYFTNTIIAGNSSAGTTEKNCQKTGTGTFGSLGYNIDGGTTCGFAVAGDQSNVTSDKLKLGALASNGGSTPTQALSYGSYAIEAVPSLSCIMTTDQRSIPRPQGVNCDVGAYEFQDSDDDHSPSGTDCNDGDATVYTAGTFYQDLDGDGLGNPNVSAVACLSSLSGYVANNGDSNDQDADNDGVSASSDCDDHNATIISSPQTYYEDADGDGQGNANSATVSCTQPSGYVTNSSDTDDTVGEGNGVANTVTDTDKDGLTSDQDCNDSDATITYQRTYYKDGDSDTVGGTTTTVICSNTAPTGYVTTTGDCDDTNADVTTTQTYYQDLDSDGQGNASVSTSVCSSTAPTGYTINSTDIDDTVDSSLIELPDDGISNDGDADIDEVNTVAENGIYAKYGSTDPTDADAYASSISKIKGKKNGKIRVTFADGVKYVYPIFSVESDSKTKVKQYHNSGYLVVLNPVGKKVALVNPYTGAVVTTLSIQTETKYSNNSLKQANLRTDQDNTYEMVVTSLQGTAVRLSIVKVNIKKLKLSLKDTLTATLKNVDVGETELESTMVTVRTAEAAAVKQFKVASDYTFDD